jgi:3-oxoacyl-[acyl-carrier protein] reductase
MDELNGQVALITGSSRGIGRACALRLARAGAAVVLNYRHQAEAGAEVQAEITRLTGRESLCLAADITSPEAIDRLFSQIEAHHGRLDILVNNAALNRDRLLLRLSTQDWEDVVTAPLQGLYHCSRRAAKLMLRQKSGRIINLSSVVALTGNAGQSAYATAKAGILGFTRSLAQELAPRGILVNAIAPGYIESDMTATLSPEQQAAICEKIPLGRFGRCDEVAEMVLFLSSDKASYLTGQTLILDGGLAMR